jgi:hypothetical protein
MNFLKPETFSVTACEARGSHSGAFDYSRVPACDAVSLAELFPAFRKNVVTSATILRGQRGPFEKLRNTNPGFARLSFS